MGPGFDRLYVDSIVGLLISVILLIYFNDQNHKSDFILLFLIVLAFPMIKPNALVIICGLLPIFLFYSIFQKKVVPFIIIILAILFNFLFTKFYIHSFQVKEIKKTEKNIFKTDSTSSFNLGRLTQYNFYPFEKIINNKKDFINTQFKELKENGIYHAKTFLVFNKILDQINFEKKIIEIPLNIFFWFLIILLISYFISKNDGSMKLTWLILLYLSFLITYFIFLTYWASMNNLINDDFTMSISWERHLGTIILGIILFLLTHYFKIYKNYIILISALVVSLNITLPNSIRVFMPVDIINKNQFWEQKYQQRAQIKNISKQIKNKLDDYSNLLFLMDKPDDPYFIPILKYELIKINTVDIKSDHLEPFLNSFSFKNSKLYIIADSDHENIINIIYQSIENKENSILSKNLFRAFNEKYGKKFIITNKYSIDDLSIYEISDI